jgi:Flp pilus assembly protein TadG
MVVALMLPLLIGIVFGTMDVSRVFSSKQILQDSLDAATLYAARSTATTDADLQTVGSRGLAANILNLQDATLVSATFRGADNSQRVVGTAQGTVDTTILGLMGTRTLTFNAVSEVVRANKNLEVALVLDTTNSMKGQNIEDMKQAASDLIDIVVKDTQTPFYSKVALVPYSMAVNVGTYAAQVRGTINTTTKAITGATKANPVVITSSNHGYSTGDKVYITGVRGMTRLNDTGYTITKIDSNRFYLQGVDATSYLYGYYTSGGTIYCAEPKCQYYNFDNPYGTSTTFEVSTCVTERTGANAYTDVAPSTTLFGLNYPSDANPCLANTITPLSSNKTTLKTSLGVLTAGGSTGGHIGVGWGWYMISPNFGYLWPAASRPAAYTAADLIKAVVIMTDGEYNSPYCNGVIARDATTGSGAVADHESCNAPNGSTYSQAVKLCQGMKAAGVVVYVVGFQVVNTQAARDLVSGCATDSAHIYTPSNGTDLKTAFQSIGQDLSNLRISR